MTAERRPERAIDAAILFVAAAVLAVVGYSFVRAALEFPLSRDSAHWLPHARQVAAGMTPFVDFDPAYAPGPFYLTALLGTDGLRSPTLVKAYFYAFHVLNGCLLYALLRRLTHPGPTSALLSACYLAWICACDGFAVEVEPMQVAFALGAAWLLSAPCSARTAAAAGLLTGASLMMKQYSLLFVPPLALAAWGSVRRIDDGSPPGQLGRRRWMRLAVFLGAVPFAFTLFVLVTWQSPVKPLVGLATYGGNRYAADGLRSMLATLVAGRAARPLVVAGALAAATLAWRRTPRAAIVCLGLGLSMAPLAVRSYEHYVQLAAPWAIVAVAEFASACGERFPPARRTAAAVAVVCLLGWVDAMVSGIRDAHRRMTRTPISSQIAIAHAVERAVGDPADVMMVNLEWVYALSDIRQPLPRRDMRYGEPLAGLSDHRDAARCAVVGPGLVPIPEAVAWLEAGGFRQRATIDPDLPLLYFERAPK